MASSSSYNQTFSSSASTSPTSWDVFISFRGIDTRFKFTSHLYAALDRQAVRTFKDDSMLSTEELILDSLLQPVQKSKTYIVVFSENYASSRWCLDDLVEILKCCETMQRSVIPVFYNIDQSVVRNQSGSFNEAFKIHETRFDMDKLAKWRAALTKVGNLSGYQVCEKMSEADIINKVVDGVLLEINPMTLDVAQYPVGLDSRVKDITALLCTATEGVTRIGIYGMGGVGKTTLARAVYNQNCRYFKGSCFLANVREVLGTGDGLVCLQQQLLNNILKCKNIKIDNVDQGIEFIRARICSTKVLIVFDDLDDPIPLEFLEGPFALGSLIVITTRNEDLLDSIGVEARYKVNELCDAESHQLFSQHAFGVNIISDTYMELSKDILKHAGGLPLALKVFGSNLLTESQEGSICIDRLKRDSIDNVEKKLVISFDALKLVDPMLQDIFLDIACFFIGQKKEKVAKVLETCHQFTNYNIDILKKRCLLTINKRDELGMHDLLRDMGRKIARNNSLDDPGKHSRLWVSKDISGVLKNHEGTEAIEGIIPHNFNYLNALVGISFTTKAFKNTSKLRLLYLDNLNITGSFENIFEDLRFLNWERCPLKGLPTDFYPQKLVTLFLPQSKMRTMWELSMIPKVFEKLKTLSMVDSKDLIATPDFTKLPSLEYLNFKGCGSLEEVHTSVGSLARLVYFSLRGCVKLRSLPDSICNLRALKSLDIAGCNRLEALPKDLGNIESLKELNAERVIVWQLPDSIGRLRNLVELRLSFCRRLKTLPSTISRLKALKVLTIEYCTSLETLPAELGNLESLIKLNAASLSLSKLPYSIGYLSKLVELNLICNKNLQSLPDTICNLKALEVLNLNNCNRLEALPIELGNIESLKQINAERLAISELPRSIGSLSKLVSLRLCNNQNLKTLPNTICNLRELQVLDISDCNSLEALPTEIGNIESLKELNADFLSISKLPDSIGRLTKLVELKLSFNTKLKSLPDTICNLRALEVLRIKNCCSLEALPIGLGSIESLKELNAEGLSISKLPDSMGQLNQLVELRLRYNKKLKSLPGTICNLRSLQALSIDSSSSLEALPTELGNIESLKEFNAKGLAISGLPDSIGLLSKLVTLRLSHNKDLKTLPDTVCNLRLLEILEISGCGKLETLPEVWKITSLRELDVSGIPLLKTIPDIASSHIALSLKRLDISRNVLTALPSGISQLSNLEHFNLEDCRHLLFIAELPLNLKEIIADGCTSLKSIMDLSNLKHLETLGLANCSGLRVIFGLEDLTSIKSLHLGGCDSSLLAYTFTKRFFQRYSEFGRTIRIYTSAAELNRINQSSNIGSAAVLESMPEKTKTEARPQMKFLLPKVSQNYLAMVLCFTALSGEQIDLFRFDIRTTTSHLREGHFGERDHRLDFIRKHESVMMILPKSIFLVREGDRRIDVAVYNAEIQGIHLVHKMD